MKIENLNILYIHGFNGKPKGGTYDGLNSFFSAFKNCRVISFPYPQLHLDAEKTIHEIETQIEENKIDILVGASLGGFYTLTCKKNIKKIAINPCMLPSKEIPMLKDKITGEPVVIEEKVLSAWKKLEDYNLTEEQKNAFGIFGKADATFHYDENHTFKPLFEKIFAAKNPDKPAAVYVPGEHSLEIDSIKKGLEAYFGIEN